MQQTALLMAIALKLAICLSFTATAQNAGIAAYKKTIPPRLCVN